MYIDKTQESTVQAFGIKKKRVLYKSTDVVPIWNFDNCELYQTLFIYFYYNL